MTGPVSGSFIHWVLFSGFSSMSSNAAGRRQSRLSARALPSCRLPAWQPPGQPGPRGRPFQPPARQV